MTKTILITIETQVTAQWNCRSVPLQAIFLVSQHVFCSQGKVIPFTYALDR